MCFSIVFYCMGFEPAIEFEWMNEWYAVWGAGSDGPRNNVSGWGADPKGKEQCWGLKALGAFATVYAKMADLYGPNHVLYGVKV